MAFRRPPRWFFCLLLAAAHLQLLRRHTHRSTPWILPRFGVERTASSVVLRAAPSPEAWREFRAQLIAGGLKTTEEEVEGGDGSSDAASSAKRRAVAPRNERLLREQNEELWNEYINGAWAHLSPVEVGGLLCRVPLPAQLTRFMRQGNSSGSVWGERLRERLLKELPEVEEGRSKEELFSTWSQNTNYCYKLAEGLVDEALRGLVAKADNGRLDPRKLDDADRELLMLYGSMDETWQSVCLVLATSPDSAAQAAEAVAINRPFARNINQVLADLLLNGQDQQAPLQDEETVRRCADAFGDEAAVYLGGPHQQKEPGLFLHGFSALPGATEIAPGTRIYSGGVKAAIEGVLEGRFSPLDFRWFVGRHRRLSIARGEWLALACARPIALKQCLGLPKPLWHEVMELCGGEEAELSRIELVRRTDIEEEEEDQDDADA